jgi:uncharacterized protein (TIGR03083 family)
MKISPRYDGPPIVTLAADARGGGAGVGDAFLRQRRRFLGLLEGLSDDDWRAPSRCEGWTVQDVATHLEGVNRFWHLSIAAGLAGEPTRYLADFDPKATPAAMVDAAGSPPPAETLAGLAASSEALCDAVAALDDDQWSTIVEVPAGHLPIRILAHHALWDCWVHERDVALPLGLPVVEEPDEVMACLRFAAALGPAFAVENDRSTPSALVLETTDPDGCVVVEVTDHVAVSDRPATSAATPASVAVTGGAPVVVRDTAVNLVEALSARAPLDYDVPEDRRWLLSTLGTIFESV